MTRCSRRRGCLVRVFTVTQSMRGGSLPIRGGREQRRTRGSNSLCSDDIHWSSQLVASASRVLRSASETPPFGPVIVGTPLQSIVLTMRPEAFVDCAVNVPPMYAPEP
jgi:hypothetical protein